MDDFKKIQHKRLRFSMLAESPPYLGAEISDPYTTEIPSEYEPEYRRYLALAYSYDGYRKFPGNSAMALYGHFRTIFDNPRTSGELPSDVDLLRMLLFVAERNARHQGWYSDLHKRFVTSVMEKLREYIEKNNLDRVILDE